jgi:hypothetical protein
MMLSAGQFSPASLFAAGEQGAWYDPSDFSTMFQDSVGTTPVTAVEQPVGLILDKRGSLVSYNPATMTISSYDGGGATTIVRNSANLTFTSAASGDGIRFNAITTADNYSVIEFIASGSGSLLVYAGGTPLTVTLTGTPTAYRAATQPNLAAFTIFRSNSAGLSASITINSVYAIRGNHASQSTSASRPVLSARVNLLTYSEQFDNAAWTKPGLLAFGSGSVANATAAPDGTITADLLVPNTTLTNHATYVLSALSAGVAYTASVYAKVGGYDKVVISDWNEATRVATFDLTNVTATLSGSGATVTLSNAIITSVGNGWYRCSVQITKSTTGQLAYFINSAATYAGDGTSGIYIWGADLRVTNDGVGIPAYQRIAAATDYDTSGFPLYLKFDGTDDTLLGSAVSDFISASAYEACVGARFNAVTTNNVNSWLNQSLVADSAGYVGIGMARSTGVVGAFNFDATQDEITVAMTPPATIVLQQRHSGGNLTVSTNQGAEVSTASGNTAALTGVLQLLKAFGSVFTNGRLYGVIIRNTAFTTAERANVLTWMNGKTKAY